MAEIKALTINSKTVQPGIKYAWDSIKELPNFTKNILIPEIAVDKDGNSTVDIGSIVSGMPTVFARANLFRNALDAVTDKDAEAAGLMRFYKSLLSEWKGFIACIALDYKDIQVDRVHLAYSDGKKIEDTANLYEPLGAFGNVLFERQPLWCDQSLSNNADKIPFIDVISFKGNVVGGTSPDCFLFSSVSYRIKEKLPFININNGKFIDPLQSELKPEELFKIYGYAKHILHNIDKFKKNFDGLEDLLKPDYSNMYGCLQNWMLDMVKYQEAKGYPKLEQQTPPEVGSLFNYPFSLLFNFSTELYGSEGIISGDAGMEGSIAFDPKDLLLPESTEIAQIDFGKEGAETKNYLRSKPLLLLEASTKGQANNFAYFTLPLTPLALNVFGANLTALVGLDETSNVKSRISAIYDPNDKDGEKLMVQLKLFTNTGNEITKQIIYKVTRDSIIGQDILIWPNFISKQWNRYFMFSEIPHNDAKFRATPFIGNVNADFFRILLDENKVPLYLANNGKATVIDEKKYGNIKTQLHVSSNNAVADNKYKYEIYESNQPFKGIKFSFGTKDCGFGIIRYSTTDKDLPKNMLDDNIDLANARLGIDFGSTNSSVAYYSLRDQKLANEIKLRNRRISLLANDNKNNDERPAVEDEIFFFQNDEIRTNAIKSVLTVHDPKRIVKESETQSTESLFSDAIKGGFPCFEKNLPIEAATDNRYTLKYNRVGSATIVHNMKWSVQEIENSYKKAYLGSLLLHIYAQLFEEGHIPIELKWSYPSSMSNSLILKYIQIWTTLDEVNPINGGQVLKIFKPDTSITINASGAEVFGAATGAAWGSQDTKLNENQGWGTVANNNPWGAQQEAQQAKPAGNWGTERSQQQKLKEIKTDFEPIRFDFKKLQNNESLTEACAVANYIANSDSLEKTHDYLTLCFDVGGSTTDITALCMMRGKEDIGLAMVKQNSIRFAAQRVSFATKSSPNFRAVLLEICERKKIFIHGLNKGDDKFSPDTAPYFFEQVVDRLDEADFPVFYELISGKCPEMMSVNIYVTGLIMYYAGQLAFKLRNEIARSEEKHPLMADWKPVINIVFAGKGARIFDWFKAINPQASNKYFIDLFIAGFGGMQKAMEFLSPTGYNGGPPIRINPTNESGTYNIKYEVSKGLAGDTDKLLVPQNKEAIEILGEDGFIIVDQQGQKISLSYENSVTTEMFEHIGTYFLNSPVPGQPPCPRFMDFAGIFFQVATSLFGLKMTQQEFMAGFQSININSYIKSLPEYKQAVESYQKGESTRFDYVAPIIILEGMKFMEDHLLKGIKKQ
jgi:hypothetical protein